MSKRFLSTISVPSLASPPAVGHSGTLYFNTEDKTLHVHDGTQYVPVSVDMVKQMFLGGKHEGIDVKYDTTTETLGISIQSSEYTREPTGFADFTSSILEWNDSSKILTLKPVKTSVYTYRGQYSASYPYAENDTVIFNNQYYSRTSESVGQTNHLPTDTTYWSSTPVNYTPDKFVLFVNGIKYEKPFEESIEIPTNISGPVPGKYYLYYDGLAQLQRKTTPFDLKNDLPVAIAVIGTDGNTVFVGEERHGMVMDWATHYYLHKVNGTQYVPGGFNAGNYTITGDGSLNSHAQLSLTGGQLFDEDNDFTISHNSSPTIEGQQHLEPYVKTKVLYRSGSGWKTTSLQNYGFRSVANVPQFSYSDAGSWTDSSIENNKYFVSYIVATNNILCPILSIEGQAQYNNLNAAKDSALFSTLDLAGIPSDEWVALYRVIYHYNTSFTNDVDVVIVDVQDLKQSSSTSGGQAASNHSNLVGLLEDDHTQYVHISNPRTIIASHTFNPTTEGPAFILGANASGQLIPGLNAELLDGSTLADINSTAFTYAQNATTDAIAAAKGYTDQEIADLIGTAPGVLDTLGEIADALNDDANFASTITTSLAGKAPLSHTHTSENITDFNEAAQDAVASLFTHANHSNITATYDDVNNKIVFTVSAQLTQEQIQDYISPLLTHANHTNIVATYDDDNNRIVLEAITEPSKAVMSPNPPLNPANGAFWFDTDEFRSGSTKALKVYNAFPPAYVGIYDNGADYYPGDVVSYNGSFYIRINEPNPGYPPGTPYWETYTFTAGWEYVSSDLSLSTTNVWTAKNTFNQGVIIGLDSAPSSPDDGQVYYDKTTNNLRVFNGTQWTNITGGGGGSAFDLVSTDTTLVPAIMFFGAAAPANGSYSVGDLWVDIDDDAGDTEFIHVGPEAPADFGAGTLWVDTDEPEGQLIYSAVDAPTGDRVEGDLWIDIDDLTGQLVHIGDVAPDAEDSSLWIDVTTEEGLETFNVEDVFEGNRSVYSTAAALPNPATHGGMIAFVEDKQQFYVAFSDTPEIVTGGTFSVSLDNGNYYINNQTEPTLNLIRGRRYAFAINTPGNQFWIKTKVIAGTSFPYPVGIVGNGTASGTIFFDVPYNAPDKLYYVSQTDVTKTGEINITGVVNPTGSWRPLTPDLTKDNIARLLWMGF
jgi:hypothetical protein